MSVWYLLLVFYNFIYFMYLKYFRYLVSRLLFVFIFVLILNNYTSAVSLLTGDILNIIDWDTIEIRQDWEKKLVRLIWIDTPEYWHDFYDEAKIYLTLSLSSGSIKLLSDPYKENEDKFGRLLRYVFVDGRNVNLWLISRGFAKEFSYDSIYLLRRQFFLAQFFAQNDKIGLWKTKNRKIYSDCYSINLVLRHDEFKIFSNGKKISCDNGLFVWWYVF